MTTDIGRSGADAPSGHSAEPEPCCTVSAVPVSVPNAIRDAVLKMGKVDWGGVGPKPDAEHVSDFADSLAITREHFGLDGPRYLCGVYLEGTETVLCHTGTSPNSPTNARTIAGIWNWLVEQCAASAIEAATAGETTQIGSTEGESAVAESQTPNSSRDRV